MLHQVLVQNISCAKPLFEDNTSALPSRLQRMSARAVGFVAAPESGLRHQVLRCG